ncbi:MAG TPA: adenylate/guanylate cyclase domain-containing protein [Propylenella sp.]|nr:adenylate/guanylate cyclase domain-containing protein [Propylenella sp.]
MTPRRAGTGARRRAAYVWSFGLASLFTLISIASVNQTALDRLTALVFDSYQVLKPRQEAGAPVAIVDIDEESIRSLGQWPWPRPVVARMVDRLGDLGAATIAFDIVFSEPDRTSLRQAAADLQKAGAQVILPVGQIPDNDAVLAEAFARNSVTAGFVVSSEASGELPDPKAGFAFAGRDPQTFLASFSGGLGNLPTLSQAAQGLGFFSFPPSRDGVVRAIPLVARAAGKLVPSLSVEALRVAQGAGSFVVKGTGASGEADTGAPAMVALKVGAFEVPTGPGGEFWVYYSGIPSVPVVSAAALLDDAQRAPLEEAIAGRIVLVGTSAVGLRDLVATPLVASTAGVNIHAEVIDQVIGGVFLTRPDWAKGAEIAAAVLLGLLMTVFANRCGAMLTSAVAMTLTAAALAASWFAFTSGQLLLDPILPAAAVAVVFAVTTPLRLLLTDRERQFVRDAFGRYLAPSLVERLAENPEALKLGGEMRELTILFSDIRGFTTLSERLDPQALTQLLNDFLTPMTDVLLKSEATIDKYIGDAIMAFWNAPIDTPDHKRRACLAALEMLKALDRLNEGLEQKIALGIGLNSGGCCVGNLGSAQRFSYSAIGDCVNVASRVEGLTKVYGVAILVTEHTRVGAQDLALLEVDLVRVVGRAEPIAIYTVLGDADFAQSAEFKALADAHSRMIAAYRAAECACAETALSAAAGFGFAQLEKLYQLYGDRLSKMRVNPPGAGWDGVFVSVEK